MSTEVAVNFNKIISNICNQLLTDHKLITTKTVIAILTEIHPNTYNYTEELVTNKINAWRVARIKNDKVVSEANASVVSTQAIDSPKYNKLLEHNIKYRKQLADAKREMQFLKAKIQSLNGLYNRQRKELIMKIEGMLYKNF